MKLAFDEAGHTGSNLLDRDQPYFVMASVNLSDEEASEIIAETKEKFRLNHLSELKSSKLLRRNDGQKIVLYILDRIDGKYAYCFCDKLFALCESVYEQIIEPVYPKFDRFFTMMEFNKYIAKSLYVRCIEDSRFIANSMWQIQEFMKSFDMNKAPILFDGNCELKLDPISCLYRFTNAFKCEFEEYTKFHAKHSYNKVKWLLDLSETATSWHLDHWAKNDSTLSVIIDNSKPLTESQLLQNPYESQKRIASLKNRLFGLESNDWKLENEIEFCDSKEHSSIQLADIVAGTVLDIVRFNKESKNEPLFFPHNISKHALPDGKGFIWPDSNTVNFSDEKVYANWAIFNAIAELAEKGQKFRNVNELRSYFQ